MTTVSSCHRCDSVIEAGDLRCPVCHLPVPYDPGARDGATRIHIFRCPSCGPAMEYQVRVQAPQCAFCGAVLKLEEQIDPVEQTERYLPFSVDRAAADAVYRAWLSRQGFFRPSNLSSAARLESLRPLWWVGWVVNADAVVTWTLDSNAGARRAGWAPQAGELRTTFEDIVIPATRGLSPTECAGLLRSYALASGEDGPDQTIADAVCERFESARSVARARIVEAIQRMAEARIKSNEAPGTNFRNYHASVHLRGLRSRRVSFPAYAIAYRYGGRLYRTVISGQDPACVIGTMPRSLAKVFLIVALLLAVAVAVAFALIVRLVT